MEKVHAPRDLDISAAGRGVWLVKVPKYLAEKWKATRGEVGRLKISKSKVAGGKPDVMFSLKGSLAKGSGDEQAVPTDHRFVLTGPTNQSLFVLRRDLVDPSPVGELQPDKVAIDGKVIHRAECRPIADDTKYMQLKRQHVENVNKPTKQIKQLDRAVQSYKPVSVQPNEAEHRRKKQEEGKKSRLEKDQVLDVLFQAFEKHQYYNVRDLVRLTNQPIPYLKEILKEYCIYNMKAPHRNMWELKPEYRHYKSAESE